MIPRQLHGREPKLGLLPIPSNVDVHRLMAVETVEKEAIWSRNTGNGRHSVDSTPDVLRILRICQAARTCRRRLQTDQMTRIGLIVSLNVFEVFVRLTNKV